MPIPDPLGILRRDYREGELRRRDLSADPLEQFRIWFDDARTCEGIAEPNAMTLATAGRDGRVTSRTVLLKACDERGFAFFTNYASEKADQIAENPRVSLLFPWLALERQIEICGRAEKVSRKESLEYFASRPLASRLGAWASRQSHTIPNREALEEAYREVERRFADGLVPLPDLWGGYRILPETMEFWQGRPSRLHDRFLYEKQTGGEWMISRLSP